MGEDEDGVVVGRVVAPPALPLLVAPGTAAARTEHVAAHQPSADILERFLEYPRALVHLAPLVAVGLAPSGQRDHPVMESLAAFAEGLLLALVRAGDETVQRDRDLTPNLAHLASSVGGHCGRGFCRAGFGRSRNQSGYSSFRKVPAMSGWAFGVRSSKKLKYGATNGSGADTV